MTKEGASPARERLRTRLRELIAPVGPALDLAVFRITIGVFLAWNESVVVADALAGLPPEARVAPTGVGWLLPLVSITPALVRGVRYVLWAACCTGALGLFSRTSFLVASLSASYVMMAPQLTGAVFHDHHLLWFAALLAASPSGDALSVDAWLARRRGRPRPTHGRAHGATVRLAWLFIGCVFFFPGVHKLSTAGLAWITSDNLRNQLWWKWAQDPRSQPGLRIDRSPALLHALAALTILFELTFLPLAFHRRSRAVVVIGALLFHQATDYFMGVRFTVLWVTYTVFVPWEATWRWIRPRADVARNVASAGASGVGVVGALLLAGIVSFGALGITNGYPFACFPTFEWMPADRMPALEIEVERADGTTRTLERELWRDAGPREWALEWSVAGVYGPYQPDRAEAFFRQRVHERPALADAVAGSSRVGFSRVLLSVDPATRYDVLSRETLGDLVP